MLLDQPLIPDCAAPPAGLSGQTTSTRIIGKTGPRAATKRTRDHTRCLGAGDRVAEFEILGTLGRGGFGAVYLTKTGPSQRFVLKEYFPHDIAYREPDGSIRPESPLAAVDFFEGLSEFAREADRLDRLDHPNIPRLGRFLTARGTAYFAMPYSLGQTLGQELLGAGPLNQRRFEKIFPPTLDALEYVHDRGFLHRDIKPANIYITNRDVPYLIDFGTARTTHNRRCSALGEAVTRGFSPSEQYRCESLQTPATDIYSMAATMYLAITGTMPPEGLDRLTTDAYVPVAQLIGRRFPRRIKSAIDAALAPRAKDRPQSVSEFRAQMGLA